MDAAPPVDAGHTDASLADSGPALDAGTMDAGPMDAEAMDAMVDAGTGLCAPTPAAVPRNMACDRLTEVLEGYLTRCNPGLAASDAEMLATRLCNVTEGPLTDLAASYDAIAAGACACAIDALPCGDANPFGSIAACAVTVTGTITDGDACFHPHRCAPGLECAVQGYLPTGGGEPIGVFGQIALGKLPCPGECGTPTTIGTECSGNQGNQVTCSPGQFCDFGQVQMATCQPIAQLGEDCDRAPCAGASAFLFVPTTECVRTGTIAVCAPLRATGQTCGNENCNVFNDCDDTNTCVLRPGEGAACTLSIDTTTPDFNDRYNLIGEANEACSVTHEFAAPGLACVQTSSRTGNGTCERLPGVNEACGIGEGLSARCADGAYCPAIDPQTFAPVMGTCMLPIAIEELCDENWDGFLLNPQCADTLAECFSFDGKARPRCHAQLACFEIQD